MNDAPNPAAEIDEHGEVGERNLRVLEAVLFASSEPLSLEEIVRYVGEGADVSRLLGRPPGRKNSATHNPPLFETGFCNKERRAWRNNSTCRSRNNSTN